MKRPVNKGKTLFRDKASKGSLPRALWNRLERFNALGIRTAGFLHQLKTPLQVIQSQAEFLMEDKNLSEPVRGSLSMILQNAERMGVQTRELMRWAKGDNFSMQAAPLTPLLDEICHLSGTLCRKKGIVLQKDFQAQASVSMDYVPLQGAIQNFVVNAIEAMPRGGHLILQSYEEPERKRVLLVIEDTGPGMDARQLARVQQPFQSSKSHGTGLGLFIARHVLRRHHARVQWQSRPGHGTTVTLLFPMARTQ